MGRLSDVQTFLGWGLEAVPVTSFSDGDNITSEWNGSCSDWDSSTTVEILEIFGSDEFARTSRDFHNPHQAETGHLLAEPERTAISDVKTRSQFDGNLDWFEGADGGYSGVADSGSGSGSGLKGFCVEGSVEAFMWQLEWKVVDFPNTYTQARARALISINGSHLNPAAPAFVPLGNSMTSMNSHPHNIFPVLDEQASLRQQQQHYYQQYYPWQNQSAFTNPFRAPKLPSRREGEGELKDEFFSQHDGYMTSLQQLPVMGWPPLPPLRIPKHRKKRYPASYGRVCRQFISRKELEGLRISCEQIFSAEYHRKGRYYSEESDKAEAKKVL